MNPDYIKAAKVLNGGGIAVIPTDTIYGVVGSALDEKVVEKIYEIRNRPPEKRMIVLAADSKQLEKVGFAVDKKQEKFLEKVWPGPVSVHLKFSDVLPEHLHRGHSELAVRIPNKKELLELLRVTEPLVAPSANLSGEAPAKTAVEAEEIFGEKVDLYIEEGELSGEPSTIIGFSEKGELQIFREGAVSREELEKMI